MRVDWKNLLVFAFLLSLASAGMVQKYLGVPGVVANFLIAVAIPGTLSRLGPGVSGFLRKRFTRCLAVVGGVLAIGYCIANPLEDRGGVGRNSDRDEGLEIAVHRLVAGETPYYADNPVAGPLSVLPGAVFLSVPFVLLGDVGYQNVFWILVAMVAGAAWSGNKALAVGMPLGVMAASPSVLHEFVSGGDLIANGLYVAVLMGWCFREWTGAPGSRNGGWKWLSAVLFGISMASRPNFLLLYPLFACGLWRVAGFRVAASASCAAALVSVCLIFPFYINDPAGFTPWIARKKLAVADHVLPWAGTMIIGITVFLSLAVSAFLLRARGSGNPLADLCRCCAYVILCPMACAILARSWLAGALDFGFMLDRFGVMYMGFALFGWGAVMMSGGVDGGMDGPGERVDS